MSDEQKKVEKSDLDVEELGKDTKAKNQMIKGKMLKENLDDLGDGYTHFAIMKSNNKIADGWDYSELYDEETRSYDNASIKEYTKLDLTDNFPENKPSDFKILTRKSVEKMGLNPKDTNNWYKPGMNENLDQHYSQDDEDLSMDLSQSEECKSCNRDKPELDIDVMDPNELERLSKIIEEWGLTEYDLEDPDVIEELTDEFQRRNGDELQEITINSPIEPKWIKYIKDQLDGWEYEESITWDLPVDKGENIQLQKELEKNNGDLRINIDGWPIAIYNIEGGGVEFEIMDDQDLDEGIALKDKAGNVTYAKDDNEANQTINNARTKNVQLTKQNV